MKRVPSIGVLLLMPCLLFALGPLSSAQASAQIRFCPDRTEISPGDTIVWTIEVLDESILPLTVCPEFNNDKYREPTIRVDTASIEIEYLYETANFYMPYIEVDNYRGYREKVYSDRLVSVIPDLEERQGIGLSLPSPDNPTGDYIKGMNIFTFEYALFDTAAGEQFIQGELDRIAALGCNMVIFNVAWFNDTETSSLQEPIYGNAWPSCWVGTLPVDALVALADWCHSRGLKVCFRYFLRQKGDHGSTARAYYSPANSELYIEQQTAIKVEYARLCEKLGVELFCLDSENQYFTRASGVSSLIQEVRAVYGGAITNGAWDALANYSCPYASELDVLAWSDYYLSTHDFGEDSSAEALSRYYEYHYGSEIRPMLAFFDKPGLAIETGADIRNLPMAQVEQLYSAYLSSFAQLQNEHSRLCGNAWWVWNLSDPQVEPGAMRGTSAESILGNFFRDVISPVVTIDCQSGGVLTPSTDLVLERFDKGMPDYDTWHYKSSISLALESGRISSGQCLEMSLDPTSEAADHRYGFIWSVLSTLADWSDYSSLCFWVKSAAANWGIEVNVVDADGDRFNIGVDTQPFLATSQPESEGWHLVVVPFDMLTRPSWATDGDGQIDWHHVAKYGFGFVYQNHGAQTIWIDDIYLSKEGSLEYWLAPSGDGTDSAGSGENQAADSDGDGVPGDQDYCLDWPGDPDTNGCLRS